MASIPGIPKLLKPSIKAIGLTLLGNAITALWNLLFPGPTWGVFKVGTSDIAIKVSSVGGLDVAGEARVSDYPIQTGSFTSYNKVVLPNIITIQLTKDGGEDSRQALLAWLEDNKGRTTLFDILSPEWRYSNMTLVGYRLSRSARSGAAMVIADCMFQQVRENPPVYSSTTIADPGNQSSTPTARAYPAPPDKPLEIGGPISWQ